MWVITGGPHTGKSALIKNLKQRGYKTIEEAARDEINSGFDKGRTIEQIRADEVDFQMRVQRLKEEREDETPEQELVLWDRGLDGDSLAYFLESKRPRGYSEPSITRMSQIPEWLFVKDIIKVFFCLISCHLMNRITQEQKTKIRVRRSMDE